MDKTTFLNTLQKMELPFDDSNLRAVFFLTGLDAAWKAFWLHVPPAGRLDQNGKPDISRNDLTPDQNQLYKYRNVTRRSNLFRRLFTILMTYMPSGPDIQPRVDALFQTTDQNAEQQILTQFSSDYPLISQYLVKKQQEFLTNILEIYKHVDADWQTIDSLFTDKRQKLRKLWQLTMTGSDYHKGGKQVVILTFRIEGDPLLSELKLVYKPSDVSTDCRLIGTIGGLLTTIRAGGSLGTLTIDASSQSLFEIVNGWIAGNQDVYPNLLTFPTYRILPYPQAAIKDSYGYIEYLTHRDFGSPFTEASQVRGDYVLEGKPSDAEARLRFFRLLGQLRAMAITFSLTDLHNENLIAHAFLPYLIDLEVTLHCPVNTFADTALSDAIDKAKSDSGFTQNMLFKRVNGNLEVIRMENAEEVAHAEAANQMLLLLKDKTTAPEIAIWFQSCKNAFVRVVPIGTTIWTYAKFRALNAMQVKAAKIDSVKAFVRTSQSLTQFGKNMQESLNTAYASWSTAWNTASQNVTDLSVLQKATRQNPLWAPRMFLHQPALVLDDLMNNDVPVFYHQIGTQQLFTWQGAEIKMALFDIFPENVAPSSVVAAVADFCRKLNNPNQHFFGVVPTDYWVLNGQFMALTDALVFSDRQIAMGLPKPSQNRSVPLSFLS